MSPDLNDQSGVGPDHQLPEYEGTRPDHELPPAPRRRRGARFVGWILALVLLGIVIVWLYRHHEAAVQAAAAHHPPPAVPVTTVTARQGDIGIYLDNIGTVTPVYTDAITSEVNGLVTAVYYREGQRVKKGDPLIDIDARPYQATLLQAEGTLQRDQNLLGQAQMDLARYRAAWARNAIAKQTVDDQEKLVLQDEGTVKNDEGTVQYDQVQVGFCHLTAPISGRMGLRLVDPGNYVQASGTLTLAVITQMEPITVIFTIPEDSLGDVLKRLNLGARLQVDAYDRTALNKIASGALLTIDNQIDTTTGTVKGRALFPNHDDALFPNLFVNTRLLVNTLQGVTLIPTSAIQQSGQTSFVYVIKENVAHHQDVKTGITDGTTTQVEGITPGEVVADSSFDKLQDNVKVAISNQSNTAHNQAEENKQGQPTSSKSKSPSGSKAP